jgi:hypothetical protein
MNLILKKYGVDILGMDLSSNVIGIAWERSKDYSDLNVCILKKLFLSNI